MQDGMNSRQSDIEIGVAAAIILREGAVFLTRRGTEELYPGMWEFPGGKIENGESPEDCCRRELREELGIDAEIGKLFIESLHRYPEATVRLLVYYIDAFKGEITLSSHDRAAWVQPKDLLAYPLLPADRPVAEALLKETEMKW